MSTYYFCNVVYRLTAWGDSAEEVLGPTFLDRESSIPCSKQEVLAEFFFTGFREHLNEEYHSLGYRLELLAHWVHPIDWKREAYQKAGSALAQYTNAFPDIYLAPVEAKSDIALPDSYLHQSSKEKWVFGHPGVGAVAVKISKGSTQLGRAFFKK